MTDHPAAASERGLPLHGGCAFLVIRRFLFIFLFVFSEGQTKRYIEMSILRMLALPMLAALFLVLSHEHAASKKCGPCEYKDSFGLCLPKGGCVIQQLNPVEQTKRAVKVIDAISRGNPKEVASALGAALIDSPGCLACRSVAHNILPNLTDEQINGVAGRGFLTYLATGDPVLVVIDVAANIARQSSIKPTSPPPNLTARPQNRQQKNYAAHADCMSVMPDGKVYAGWKESPSLTAEDKKPFRYPEVDLFPGDIIEITAPLCASWDDKTTNVRALRSARLRYEGPSTVPGSKDAIKWFLIGPRI